MNGMWRTMLASVEKRRDVDARFYKPTCLLAVIDGIGDGSLAPSDLDPDRVIERFHKYLLPLFPERASLGWRPFWHLSRDGAWTFSKEGRRVGPEEFGRERKPNSRRELMDKVDHVSVPPESRSAWKLASARGELRAAVIDMLRRDDANCQRVADLLDADGMLATRGWEQVAVPRGNVAEGPARQGFQSSTAVRQAVERRAMEVATGVLAGECWMIEDVSARRSYDLHCSRGEEIRYVEVKGTTGSGSEILLTAAEVAFADLHRERMLLIVVTGIAVTGEELAIEATGGTAHVFRNWAPDPGDLNPFSYYCRIQISEAEIA